MTDDLFQFKYEGISTQRLDKFLAACLPDYSRSRLQGLIKDGFVRVNKQVIVKSGITLENGMEVEILIPPPQPSDLVPEAIALEILFENSDLVVINKPAGMVVHPAPGHSGGTLVHAALAHIPDLAGIGGEQRPGVVHRLDKDTSGIILMAKNDLAHRWLQDQFRLRRVKKVYLALVDGHLPTPNGRIEAPIGRDPSHRQRMAVLPPGKGREAVTEYHTQQTFSQHTLVEAHPLTGRTHQIRLHLAFLNCPITGDTIYGHKHSTLPIDRHFLHAARIEILLPGENQPRIFESPLPVDLAQILSTLKSI